MDIAFFTALEWSHCDCEVFYPVLGVGAASPGNNDSFGYRFVANEGSSQCNIVIDVSNIDEFGVLGGELARPAF